MLKRNNLEGRNMLFGIKSFFKVRIGIVLCVVINGSSGCFAAEVLDIDIQADISPSTLKSGFVILSDTLKLCRLIMYTIPMDRFANDVDRNLVAPIRIVSATSAVNPHPLQFPSNRQILKTYIGGRNVVITQDETGKHVMVVTGMGPKYNSLKKVEIERCAGANVIDIIDTLPEFNEGQRTEIRNSLVHYRYILELKKIISKEVDEDSFDQIQDLMKLDKTINEIMATSAIKDFQAILSTNPSAKIISNKFTGELGRLDSILNDQKVQDTCVKLINGLIKIVESHKAKQKETAITELRKILESTRTEPGYYHEIIYQVTSLDEGTIHSSLTGLKLVDPYEKGHQQALGDLFHSEPLYLLWRAEHPSASSYFFTQRDMCPACDLHICLTMLLAATNVRPPLNVLSAKAGNDPKYVSVDFLQSMPGSEITELNSPDRTVFREGSTKKLAKGEIKQPIFEFQLSKIQRYRLPYLYLG